MGGGETPVCLGSGTVGCGLTPPGEDWVRGPEGKRWFCLGVGGFVCLGVETEHGCQGWM